MRTTTVWTGVPIVAILGVAGHLRPTASTKEVVIIGDRAVTLFVFLMTGSCVRAFVARRAGGQCEGRWREQGASSLASATTSSAETITASPARLLQCSWHLKRKDAAESTSQRCTCGLRRVTTDGGGPRTWPSTVRCCCFSVHGSGVLGTRLSAVIAAVEPTTAWLKRRWQ